MELVSTFPTHRPTRPANYPSKSALNSDDFLPVSGQTKRKKCVTLTHLPEKVGENMYVQIVGRLSPCIQTNNLNSITIPFYYWVWEQDLMDMKRFMWDGPVWKCLACRVNDSIAGKMLYYYQINRINWIRACKSYWSNFFEVVNNLGLLLALVSCVLPKFRQQNEGLKQINFY